MNKHYERVAGRSRTSHGVRELKLQAKSLVLCEASRTSHGVRELKL